MLVLRCFQTLIALNNVFLAEFQWNKQQQQKITQVFCFFTHKWLRESYFKFFSCNSHLWTSNFTKTCRNLVEFVKSKAYCINSINYVKTWKSTKNAIRLKIISLRSLNKFFPTKSSFRKEIGLYLQKIKSGWGGGLKIRILQQ